MDGGSFFMHWITSDTAVGGSATRCLDGHPEVDAYAPWLDHGGTHENRSSWFLVTPSARAVRGNDGGRG